MYFYKQFDKDGVTATLNMIREFNNLGGSSDVHQKAAWQRIEANDAEDTSFKL